MLQKRAIRVINRKQYISHTDPLFKASKILKLSDSLFEYQSALFMFDYLHNSLPESFDNMFIKNNQLPNSRTTRQSNLLHIATSRSNFASRLPKFTLPKLWNKWGNNFRKICQDHQWSSISKSLCYIVILLTLNAIITDVLTVYYDYFVIFMMTITLKLNHCPNPNP